jgi:hypothetical protein
MFARSFQVVVTIDTPFGDMVLTLKGNCKWAKLLRFLVLYC